MKILALTNLYPPDFLGGYELCCAQMVAVLADRGHDVRVVTSVSASAVSDAESRVARVLELAPIYNTARMETSNAAVRDHFYLRSSIVNPANIGAIARIIEEFNPDVAFLCNLLGIGGLGVLGLLQHAGIPWAWYLGDMIPRQLCSLGGYALPTLAREFRAIVQGRYIFVSSHVLGETRAGDVDLGPHVHVLPNWVTGDRRRNRTDFFSGGQLRLVNAVGLLGEHKGTHILIDMAAKLRDMGYANFIVDVYGREDDPSFRPMLYQRDVADLVRFMGRREPAEMLALYDEYDVLAFPTWSRDPCPLAPLEAAASGCVPLISADCGTAEWLVDDVHCLKAERTADAFANRVAQILSGEVDLRAIGRRAQFLMRTDFHIDAIAPRIESILEEAASESIPKRRSLSDFEKLAWFADGLLPALIAGASN